MSQTNDSPSTLHPSTARRRLPSWIRTPVKKGVKREEVHTLVDGLKLNTVCQSAKCPNQAECWHSGTATFMILGDNCTRQCKFCAIDSFNPEPVDPFEPTRVADASAKLNLGFVVVTSVDRDDLEDKGAGHFVRTIKAIQRRLPDAGIEVLTPDFKGKGELIQQVVDARPRVFNHNMETCERLTPPIRSGAQYRRSLDVLKQARSFGDGKVAIKSGIMVGLGETNDEVLQTIRQMLEAGVQILTIGQYLPPTRKHWPLHRYVEPAQFEEWAQMALEMGFGAVASSPMVRSSYRAEELANEILGPQARSAVS